MNPSIKAIFAISAIVIFFLLGFMCVSALVLLFYQLWNLFSPRPRLVNGHLEGRGLYILQRPNLGERSGVLSLLAQEFQKPVFGNLKGLRWLERRPNLRVGLLVLWGIVILVLILFYKIATGIEKDALYGIAAGVVCLPFILIRIDDWVKRRKSGTSAKASSTFKPPETDAAEIARFRFIPKRLLAVLEMKNGRSGVDFQGSFIVHGSAVLAAGNEERGLFYDPGDLRDFCVFMGQKMAFISAVLGTSLMLIFIFWARFWRVNPAPDNSGLFLLPFPVLALVFWLCLGWLRFERLSKAMRPLIGELSRQPYGQAGGESSWGWKTPAAIMGLSMWLAWRLLAGVW